MYGIGAAFDAFYRAFWILVTLCAVFVPLGAWKLVEIIIWMCRHVAFV